MKIISTFYYWGDFQQKALIINIVLGLRMSALLMLMSKCEPVLRYWQTRTHCCGHIVADTLLLMMFLGLRKLGNICCGHKTFLNKIRNTFCVPDTKLVSATNVARAGKHLGRLQCVRNNVSSFASTFTEEGKKMYQKIETPVHSHCPSRYSF